MAVSVPEVVLSRAAVRLPAAESDMLLEAVFVPLGARPGAPVSCRPLVLALLTDCGAEEALGLVTWLEDNENVWRLLLLSSLVI